MFTKKLPVYAKAQVVVCGGGTAGVFAAIAAAEQGKDVLLIEQFGSVGGSPTNGLVTPIMHTHIHPTNPQCSYIAEKVREKLFAAGGCNETGAKFDPLMLKLILEEMCVQAKVRLLYHTFISDVIKENNRLKGIVISNKNGLSIVEGEMFIDGTGDGDVCVFAGADYKKGNPETGITQPMSLRYIVGGIDLQKFSDFIGDEMERTGVKKAAQNSSLQDLYASVVTANGPYTFTDLFKQGIANGELVEDDETYWQTFTVPGRNDTMAFNNPEFFDHIDGTNPEDLTYIQVEGKKAILRQLNFYKKHFKGFENAYISEIAAQCGIRETRHITTEYVLTAEDLVNKKKFEDNICQSNYPIDIHGKKLNFTSMKPSEDGKEWYEIPYRSLVVKGIDNLFITGRSLGAEFLAQSSLRVQHSCRASGEAAGIAAAFAIDKNCLPKEIKGEEVKNEMISKGAIYVF